MVTVLWVSKSRSLERSLAPGEAVTTTIKVKLHEFGIIDGPANTTTKLSGVRTRIQAEILEALYVHYCAHCLNLAVVKSCQFL